MNRIFTYTTYFFALFSSVLHSQTQIEIINADEIYFNQKINADRQVLLGAVKAKHKNRFLTCDSAYYYAERNTIEAFSNIHVWEGDSLHLFGQYLIYDGNLQVAEIQTEVRFEHNDMIMNSEQLEYHFESQKGIYHEKARITEKEKSLESKSGIYHADSEKFDFYGDVWIENTENILRADTVYYWLNKEYAAFSSHGVIENKDLHVKADQGWLDQRNGKALLFGNLKITDLESAHVLYADTTYLSDEMKSSISFGNILLNAPLNNDSLYLTADTIKQVKSETLHTIHAFPYVNFKTSEIIGACDSMSFNIQEEQIFMHQKPVIWLNDFQLTADTLKMQLRDNILQWATFNKNAFIASKVDSAAYNQIRGEDMKAFFDENEITNIEVKGNGETLYYMMDGDNKTPEAVNEIICSNMNILISKRKIDQISFYEKPDAVLRPLAPSESLPPVLKGFRWISSSDCLNKIETAVGKKTPF